MHPTLPLLLSLPALALAQSSDACTSQVDRVCCDGTVRGDNTDWNRIVCCQGDTAGPQYLIGSMYEPTCTAGNPVLFATLASSQGISFTRTQSGNGTSQTTAGTVTSGASSASGAATTPAGPGTSASSGPASTAGASATPSSTGASQGVAPTKGVGAAAVALAGGLLAAVAL